MLLFLVAYYILHKYMVHHWNKGRRKTYFIAMFGIKKSHKYIHTYVWYFKKSIFNITWRPPLSFVSNESFYSSLISKIKYS